MAEREGSTERKIGLAEVRALQPGQTVWDGGKGAETGFGIRRQKGPAISYVLFYRTVDGRQRWLTIGKHGKGWTPDTARARAKQLLVEVANGGDPAADKKAKRNAVTVAELCEQYMHDAEAGRVLVRNGKPKKPGTLENDRARIAGHIVPLMGRLSVAAVTKQDVERFMHDVGDGKTKREPKRVRPRGVSRVRGGRGVATRTIGLLGAIFAYAVDHRMRADNPAHGIRKYAEGRRERRLTDEEYTKLGKALLAALVPHVPPRAKINRKPAVLWPPAVAAAKFLALTGWRSSEAIELRWRDVDLTRRTAVLQESKSGKSMRPLSRLACDILRDLRRGADDALVFPATQGRGPMRGFKKFLARVGALAELPPDITAHVLRHSFASLASDLGYSEATVAMLIGHKRRGVTQRYVHAADSVLLAAADAVANETGRLMGDAKPVAEIVPLRA